MSFKSQADEFDRLKKVNSPWFSLEDGESAKVCLRSMKASEKTDATTGVTSAVMLIQLDVEYEDGLKVQTWSTGSTKAINGMIDKGIDVGSTFTITKRGTSFQTVYEFTDVVNKAPKASSTTGSAALQPSMPSQASAPLDTMVNEMKEVKQ